ncbi:MAG TPA: diiron oxygenase, partial [Streptosporangiaceae bacterium]|nr:diiron oxygenase [Streptosporangiaceae bacterium]
MTDTVTTATAAKTPDEAWRYLIDRLNRQSVNRHFDAYVDVDWDGPAMALDPEDPRWELSADDPLGATAWYRQ